MSLASKTVGLVPKGSELSGTPPEHFKPASPEADRVTAIPARVKERRIALGVRVLETDMEKLEALMVRTKATKQALIDEALRDFFAACRL